MRWVNLEYLAPIVVRVDLQTREVVRVIVIDYGDVDGPLANGEQLVDAVELNIITREDFDAAEKIANESEWPAWEVGF